jgi:hypothetical protein
MTLNEKLCQEKHSFLFCMQGFIINALLFVTTTFVKHSKPFIKLLPITLQFHVDFFSLSHVITAVFKAKYIRIQ